MSETLAPTLINYRPLINEPQLNETNDDRHWNKILIINKNNSDRQLKFQYIRKPVYKALKLSQGNTKTCSLFRAIGQDASETSWDRGMKDPGQICMDGPRFPRALTGQHSTRVAKAVESHLGPVRVALGAQGTADNGRQF